MSNTILLKGEANHREAVAGGTITPGHVVMYNSSGQFVVQGTAAVACLKMFALENESFGKEITDNYVSGDTVVANVFGSGDEVYALVAASAAAIVIGDTLTVSNDGTLKKGATTDIRIAVALEAVDNSAGGSPARIKVCII